MTARPGPASVVRRTGGAGANGCRVFSLAEGPTLRMRYQDVIRLVVAAAFVLGAVANGIMVLTAPEIYEGFADLAFFGFYRTLWQRVVLPRLRFWVVLAILFELVLGALLVSADPGARVGLALAAAYAAFLVPFWWGGGALINVLLCALMLWLLRFEYAASVLALLPGR